MEETMEQALENAETAESTGEAVSALADGIGTVFRDYLSEPLLKLLGVALILLAGAIVLKVALHIVRKALNRSPLDDMIHSFVIKGIKVVYLILMIMTVFGYLGIPMTPFITMLGACGAAVALALKDSLGNFAGGLLLILHQPFKKGDFIECGGFMGRVVEISLLYTYLDATGKTVSIPNGILANQTMINYSNEENRKIDCQFGISYGSDIEKAKAVIREIIDGSQQSGRQFFQTGNVKVAFTHVSVPLISSVQYSSSASWRMYGSTMVSMSVSPAMSCASPPVSITFGLSPSASQSLR